MAELNKDYKCSICGNVIKVIEAGSGALVCCGQPMEPVGEPVAQTAPVSSEPAVEPSAAMGTVPETTIPDINTEPAAAVSEPTDIGAVKTEETDINQ